MKPAPSTFARLDELLRHDDPQPSASRVDSGWVWAAKALAYATAIAGFLVFSGRVLGIGLPFTVVLSAVLALLVLRRVVSGMVEPPAEADAPPQERDDGWRLAWPMRDGASAAAARWDSRLNWTQSDPRSFAHTVQPMLVDLADERLRQRHGLTRSADPARARELLGDALWTFLATPVTRSPTPRELAALVATLEAL